MNNEPVAWEGAEEWEPLAWELCADEHGEESCMDIIWTTGVITEPWGQRWQKYEDEAKRMIAMVRKCTHPVKEQGNPVAWRSQDPDGYWSVYQSPVEGAEPLYTGFKELTDEEWNKAFDFYCETDEGVLKFDLELRDEWKKEQLFRWKEALRKASEK